MPSIWPRSSADGTQVAGPDVGGTREQDQAFGLDGDLGVWVDRQNLGEVIGEVDAELVASLLGSGLAAELEQQSRPRDLCSSR